MCVLVHHKQHALEQHGCLAAAAAAEGANIFQHLAQAADANDTLQTRAWAAGSRAGGMASAVVGSMW